MKVSKFFYPVLLWIAMAGANLRICADCKREFAWPALSGQAPLLNNNRADRKAHE